MSLYDIKDAFTTSYAEGKRNKYRDLYKRLDSKISRIESLLHDGKTQLQKKNTTLAASPESATGEISTTFESKLSSHTIRSNEIITSLENGLDTLRKRRDTVKGKYHTWQERCEEEDRNEKEYQP